MADDRIEKLKAEVERLANANLKMQKTVDDLLALFSGQLNADRVLRSKLVSRLARLENTTSETAQLVRFILSGRIWKLLSKGEAVLLGLRQKLRGKRLGIEASKVEVTHPIQLHLELPPLKPDGAVAGTIEIRGWAVAQDGIASLEIEVANERLEQIRFPIQRSDAAQSGFLAGLDTRDLRDGIHNVTIRAKTLKGEEGEVHASIIVNQEAGKTSEYERWLEIFESRDESLIRLQRENFRYSPKISVLVPVFRTQLQIIQETIDSVRRQSYENWELCLVDDGSELPELTAVLQKNSLEDRRVRVLTRPRGGGISAASNDALAMATGEYVALLDHDDLLAEDALFHIVDELQMEPRGDVLYSDEDHIDEIGRRFSPFFKPDWSPDLILSENYVCHLMCFRRDLALQAGGFRTQFDLSQDHDILLRMSRIAVKITHISKVLYHWRTGLESMERASNATDRVLASSRAVVENFVKGQAEVEAGLQPGRWRVRYSIPENSRVSILIPTAGKIQMLDRNLRALRDKAGYEDYEVVIIDNSKGDSVKKYVDESNGNGHPIRRFDQRGEPFNYSRLNNLAANTCDSALLLFLNDDTEAIVPGWLTAMVELAVRPEVGAVGAKLLYPNGLIQHGGVTMGLAGICGHAFKGLSGSERHYFDFPDLIRNVSAVTAACMMVRADVFRSVEGFDEITFPIAYNDVDLCLRIGAAGYRILYTPHALLHHFEAFSKSRAELHPHSSETLALQTRWQALIERDPFYNSNLTRRVGDWSLRWD